MKCRKCQSDYEPSANDIKKHDYRCLSCKREYNALWRRKRVSQGLTAYGSKTWDEEKKKSWIEQRKQNVEAKKRAAERMREYRKNPETRKRNLARWMLNRKKQSGAIHSEPCTFCGKEETQAHHPDYDKPLLIVWLCGDCHRKVHPRTRKKQLYAGNAKAEGKEG